MFPGIPIVYQLNTLNNFFKQIQSRFAVIDVLHELDSGHDDFLALVQEFVKEHTQLNGLNDVKITMLHKIMSGIIYLLSALQMSYAVTNGIEPSLKRGFDIEIKSQIPIEAGLGSSAAFAVCISSAFYIYTLAQSQPNFVMTFNESTDDEERRVFNDTVSSWAFLSERIMHGTPSGLDNTVCTFGNVVRFTKNPKRFINVAVKSTINIMLVNTGVSRNTSEVVCRVKQLKNDHCKLIDHVMDAMGALVDDVVEVC